jgi:hypothetical protein
MEPLISDDFSGVHLSISRRRVDGDTSQKLKEGLSPLFARQVSKRLIPFALGYEHVFD